LRARFAAVCVRPAGKAVKRPIKAAASSEQGWWDGVLPETVPAAAAWGGCAVRGDQQDPVRRRQAPWPALAHRVRTFAPQRGDGLAELTWTQPGERGCPGGSDAVITPDNGKIMFTHPRKR
jgi:hypothetical protein